VGRKFVKSHSGGPGLLKHSGRDALFRKLVKRILTGWGRGRRRANGRKSGQKNWIKEGVKLSSKKIESNE